MLNDIEILRQLYYGEHLNKEELERAKQVVHGLQTQLDGRVNNP